MRTRKLAHISDLHVGRGGRAEAAAGALCAALLAAEVDDVLLTGDVTDRGRWCELSAFERLFAPLRDRLVVVPGNHDRMGDGVARELMPGPRVQVERRPGLLVVRLDSTAPHNRHLLASHGALTGADLAEIERAVRSARAADLVALMLHHHVLPLPGDHLGEKLSSLLRLPNAAELYRGYELVTRLLGRCDLVLHGHRHLAGERVLCPPSDRPLHVLNAGSTPELGRVRLVEHAGGRIVAAGWMRVDEPSRRSAARQPGAALPAAA